MTEPLKYFCPRLVDYVAIIGSPNPSVDSETPQQPEILRRYPADNHEDFILPSDTAFFCQPEGCTTIGAKHMSLRDRQSFVFALTDKDTGRRRYGTCLNFYRPFKRKYRATKRLQNQGSIESISSNEGVAKNQQHSSRVKALRSHTLTSLCIISHHAMFDTFRECLNVLAKLIDVCNVAAHQKKSGSRRIHNVIWKYLICKLADEPDASVLHWVKQLETWIFRLLSSPVPVPGKCHLELHIVPEGVGRPHILALPDQTRFSLVDFPLHLPLELLGVEKCIQILECIMLEQKVLLMSRDYNALTMSVLALVAMLYPLEYMFPVIPLLPASLENSEQLLYAPTPYIIGIPASFGQTRRTCLPNDVWLFDLDSDTVTAPPGPGGVLPPLPEPEGTMLRTHFKQSLASMGSLPVKNLDDLMNQSQKENGKPSLHPGSAGPGLSFNPFIYGNDIDSVDIATRVAMVRFFAAPNILGNIQEHTRIMRLYPRPVVGFQLSSFIKSRPSKSLFICKMATTQAIEFYTEWSLNPSNLVFMRVQTGIYDPTQIGDKPRWYAHHQQKIEYRVCNNIDPAIFQLAEKHADAPTDESGASDDEHFYPTTSDSDADQSRNNHNLSQPIAVTVNDVYKPPTELHRTDTLVPANSSSDYDSSDDANSSNDEGVLEYNPEQLRQQVQIDKNENVEKLPPPRPAPRPSRPPPLKHLKSRSGSENSSTTSAPKSPGDLISNLSSDLGEAAQTASSKLSYLFDTVGDKLVSASAQTKASASTPRGHIPTHSQSPNGNKHITHSPANNHNGSAASDHHSTPHRVMSPIAINNQPVHPHYGEKMKDRMQQENRNVVQGENQVFLKETVAQVLEGHGVGWMKSGRIKKMMEDENYRNFMMSRLNTQLDNKLSDEDQTISDVQISKMVYKGMVSLLSMIIHGLEHTYKCNGSGGVASALMVLEVAATHYYVRDSKSNGSSRASSPFGSRESLVSVGKEGHATPTRQLQNKHLEQYAQHANRDNFSPIPPERPSRPAAPGTQSDGEDIMHTLVTNKSLISDKQDLSLGIHEPLTEDKASTPTGIAPSSRKNSVRSPIAHQSLRKVSSASSDRSSPTNSEAINNYSLTVTQNESVRRGGGQLSPSSRLSSDGKPISLSNSSTSSDHSAKVYVFEGLIGKTRSQIWDQMQFWEDVFLDGVAQERDIIGLDQEPAALMDRYRLLGDYEKKHMEFEEDRLLSTMLYNLTAFMVMMQCARGEVKKKNRRLLGKSHIGLQYSQAINALLDNIEKIEANEIDLKPVPSRTLQKQSFSVHCGSDNTGDMLFMEVCDDCILLRGVNGVIVNRWWYERLVNMTYCPKTKVLCLWRKDSGQTHLNKFHTKKCRDLYHSIKGAMERAAARSNDKLPGPDLGGEFPVLDTESNKSGVLQVCMDGIGLLLDKTKFFVELSRIKKCFTLKGGFFVLEEMDAETGILKQRKFKSEMADHICYAVLCVFSYVAAGTDQNSHIKE